MKNKNKFVHFTTIVAIAIILTGCAGIKRQAAEMEARGTIEAGGYTWKIPADSEGGNTIQTNGLPSKQAATEASNQLCKKYDRIAQFASRRSILIAGTMIYEFNCVK